MTSILSPNIDCTPRPIKVLKNKSILEKAKRIYIDQGYWKDKDKVDFVAYYEKGSGRRGYEISCINNGKNKHFISLGKEEFENYKYKTKKTISEVKKLFQEEKTYLEKLVKEKNQELKEINRRIIKTAGEYQNYLAYLKEDMKTSKGRKRKSLESKTLPREN